MESSKIDDSDKEIFQRIAARKGEYDEYSGALKFLSKCLSEVSGEKTVILIDEYDVPLENAYFRDFMTGW